MKYLIMQPWISYRGAETMSVGLSRELIKRGEEVKVLGLYLDRQDANGVKFILPPVFFQNLFKKSKLILYLLGAPYLFFLILKNVKNFDILVPYNLPTSWFSVLFGKPVIWMAQGSMGTSRATKIIAPSKYLAEKIFKNYKKKAIIINNPIAKISGNLNDLPPEVQKLRRENKFVFLQVGAINSQKRQVEMLEIFNKILKIEPKSAIIFVGEGVDSDKLIGKNVYLAGFVPKNKIGAYYQICDLNLLPSINETFGATPLEALVYGKNSLITTDSGIKEVVFRFAIVSSPSKNEIYKCLVKYIKNKKYYDKLPLKFKEKIINELTWKKYADKFLKEADIDPVDTYKKSYYEAHYHNAPNDLLMEREVRKNRALEYLRAQKGEKILDLGVGEGDLAYEISKTGAKVWGIDYSEDAIKSAKKRFGEKIKLFKMDASKLEFPDNYFDKIVTIDVFEHIYQKKLDKVMLEIKRVIKPNGLLVVETSPNSFFWLPIMFLGKLIFRMGQLTSEKYHINIFNYFRLKNLLSEVSDDVLITLHNDGKNFLSSRVIGSNLSGRPKSKKIIYKILRFVDFILENKLFSSSVLFGHDLWAVVHINKKR